MVANSNMTVKHCVALALYAPFIPIARAHARAHNYVVAVPLLNKTPCRTDIVRLFLMGPAWALMDHEWRAHTQHAITARVHVCISRRDRSRQAAFLSVPCGCTGVLRAASPDREGPATGTKARS